MTFRLDDDPEVEDEEEIQNEDSDPEGESDAGKPAKSADKRISEMQSERDRETARANKAEKQLKAILAAQNGGAEGGNPPAGGDAGNSAILDMARMFAVQQHPKLAEYGLTESDLNGSTPAEIAANAAELVARFEKIETRALNKVLADRGLAPEIDGQSPPPKARDYSTMPKEDFDKVLAKALGKGVSG